MLAYLFGFGTMLVDPSMVWAEVVLIVTTPAPIILMLNISPEIPTAVGRVIVHALAQFAMTTVVVEVSVKLPVMAVVEMKRLVHVGVAPEPPEVKTCPLVPAEPDANRPLDT